MDSQLWRLNSFSHIRHTKIPLSIFPCIWPSPHLSCNLWTTPRFFPLSSPHSISVSSQMYFSVLNNPVSRNSPNEGRHRIGIPFWQTLLLPYSIYCRTMLPVPLLSNGPRHLVPHCNCPHIFCPRTVPRQSSNTPQPAPVHVHMA